jgi:hypothetical protein
MGMNQTKKRLSIINLAISIGDIETIQLQMLKLAPLKSDEKIQEIIKGLQAENYAQTQALITTYIETPTEEIVQRTSQHETLTPEEEEEIIEAFDLFKVEPKADKEELEEILDLDGFTQAEDTKTTTPSVDYDTLLNLKGEDILPDNIKIEHTSLTSKDDFFDEAPQTERYNYTEVIEKDDFFDTAPEEEMADLDTLVQQTEEKKVEIIQKHVTTITEADPTKPIESTEEPTQPYTDETSKPEIIDEAPSLETLPEEAPTTEEKTSQPAIETIKSKRKETKIPDSYEPITYIDQKLKNMITQYPPLEMPEESYPSINAWLLKISKEGYTEQEIEEMMAYIQKLAKEERKAEAAQLLLTSAATHSKYAQFMLARSLFKGDLLEKNLPEAFTLINRLAMDDDYAEAICDLGQLYEYGIGIDKDKKRAEALYKEAMELGIKRAKSHYERLRKENKTFFSFFKK